MLSQEDIKALNAKLDSLGEDQVRSNIANGIYGGRKIKHVNKWLRLQEQKSSFKAKNVVVETLEYIKNNRGCNSNQLNTDIVTDLYNSGYIEGANVSSYNGDAFIELRLNINGEEYLQELVQVSDNNSPKIIQNEHHWYQKPIGMLGIGIAIAVLSTLALKVLGL